MILDFKEYMKACYEHLLSLQPNQSQSPYYEKVEDIELEVAKTKIQSVLQEGLDNKIITQEEFKQMDPSDNNPAKFYCNFKIHKQHIPMKAPPVRPIISG